MSELQRDLIILVLIIILNFIITLLFGKYRGLKEASQDQKLYLDNNSTMISTSPRGCMPRVPFLILHKSYDIKVKRIVLIHNILCLLVYALFITAIVLN